MQGIVERSDDGGRTWTRNSVELPYGSGSLFLSGIHPTDPDRMWFRVPGRGDIYGVLPTALWLSTDGAVSFEQVADTELGMLGFALSPDGDRVAFGGPVDGLFVAPADGSAPATKVDDLRVGCLRWLAGGLYVCAGEPADPYSLGLATEPMQGFVPLWHRADTCEPWEMIAPFIEADAPLCDADAGSSLPDAGSDGGVEAVVDATPQTPEPTDARPASCAVSLVR